MLQRYTGPTDAIFPTLRPPLFVRAGEVVDRPELIDGFEPVDPAPVSEPAEAESHGRHAADAPPDVPPASPSVAPFVSPAFAAPTPPPEPPAAPPPAAVPNVVAAPPTPAVVTAAPTVIQPLPPLPPPVASPGSVTTRQEV